MHLLRRLTPPEQAFTRSNEAYPLSVVCVLRLKNGPAVVAIEAALAQMQQRHPLLRAGIHIGRQGFQFYVLEPLPPVSLILLPRTTDESWRTATESALNTTFDHRGPLMKCWYLSQDDDEGAELIVAFHHAIIDGVAARELLHELLSLSGGLALETVPAQIPIQSEFPADFRGSRLALRLLPFLGRQMRDEFRFRLKGQAAPIPRHSTNAIISLQLSADLSRRLSYRVGREGLSLNGVLSAAILCSLWKHRYPSRKQGLTRVISFADLRPVMEPAPGPTDLGCCVSMLRFSLPIRQESTVWEVARDLRKAMYGAGRRGEMLLMGQLLHNLIRMALAAKSMRLGTSALSFIGKLDLDRNYGPIELEDVLAYITNNRFGPEFSGFGKVLFGRIELDLTYLPEEISASEAEAIVADIRTSLEEMAEMP